MRAAVAEEWRREFGDADNGDGDERRIGGEGEVGAAEGRAVVDRGESAQEQMLAATAATRNKVVPEGSVVSGGSQRPGRGRGNL